MKLGLGLGNDLHGQSRGGVFGGLDPATQALLDQATTDGYTAASGDTLTALDNYIKGLKADGIWSKLDLLYIFATNGDSDFATYNVLDPSTFAATKVNSPTFTNLEGFTTDGAASYLDTGWSPATNGVNYQLNSASAGVYVRSAIDTSSGSVLWGARNIGGGFSYEVNVTVAYLISSNTTTLPINFLAGFRHINRANATQISRIVNGASATDSSNSDALTTVSFVIGALNSDNSVIGFEANQFSIFFAGADLSSEASDFYTRTQNYMAALGKEV